MKKILTILFLTIFYHNVRTASTMMNYGRSTINFIVDDVTLQRDDEKVIPIALGLILAAGIPLLTEQVYEFFNTQKYEFFVEDYDYEGGVFNDIVISRFDTPLSDLIEYGIPRIIGSLAIFAYRDNDNDTIKKATLFASLAHLYAMGWAISRKQTRNKKIQTDLSQNNRMPNYNSPLCNLYQF